MTDDKNATNKRGGTGAASADVLGANTEIGRKLRQYYEGLVSEEVPDRFALLLQQLEEVESTRKPE
ncbi:MAG: NepR family anti-sigma factor [Mesorhizobium sp.]|nr:NepR family anti-sigma factor [Mesorhizobium sp.]